MRVDLFGGSVLWAMAMWSLHADPWSKSAVAVQSGLLSSWRALSTPVKGSDSVFQTRRDTAVSVDCLSHRALKPASQLHTVPNVAFHGV